MFPLLIPMMIGAAAGALTNKDNPLKGAAMGAGMGALGGVAAPAMGGLLGGGAASAAGTGAAGGAAGGTGLLAGAGAPGLSAAGGGVGLVPPAGALSSTASAAAPSGGVTGLLSSVKPYMDAAGTATQVAGMFNHPEQAPQITPSPITTPMPNNNLGSMVSGMQQQQANKIAMEKQARQARRSMYGTA